MSFDGPEGHGAGAVGGEEGARHLSWAPRILMIEDEPLARARLRRLVAELRPAACWLGEAGDGTAGLHLLRTHADALDLLFLDIELPPGGAFSLLADAEAEGLPLPPVVFVTAHASFAVDAFRWAACDYLLKPVTRPRLAQAMRRAQDLRSPALPLPPAPPSTPPERLVVHHRGRLVVVPLSEVTHLVSEQRLVLVVTPAGRFVVDRTLAELEGRLGGRFYRIHRSALVALDRVVAVEPDGRGSADVLLGCGARLAVSRDRLGGLKAALEA